MIFSVFAAYGKARLVRSLFFRFKYYVKRLEFHEVVRFGSHFSKTSLAFQKWSALRSDLYSSFLIFFLSIFWITFLMTTFNLQHGVDQACNLAIELKHEFSASWPTITAGGLMLLKMVMNVLDRQLESLVSNPMLTQRPGPYDAIEVAVNLFMVDHAKSFVSFTHGTLDTANDRVICV